MTKLFILAFSKSFTSFLNLGDSLYTSCKGNTNFANLLPHYIWVEGTYICQRDYNTSILTIRVRLKSHHGQLLYIISWLVEGLISVCATIGKHLKTIPQFDPSSVCVCEIWVDKTVWELSVIVQAQSHCDQESEHSLIQLVSTPDYILSPK